MSTKTTEQAGFTRYLAAQNGGAFEQALDEIAAGEKSGHWMWFVFPQLGDRGSSPAARKNALLDLAEARDYARHEELGPRLYEATEAMLEWAGTMDARDILGAVDAANFRSSMTLFEAACADDDNQVFSDAIDGFFAGVRCPLTLDRI